MNENILNSLQQHKKILQQRFNIKKIGIFGSYSRNEETTNSDIDILVEYGKCPSLFEIIDTEIYLEELFNKKIDLVEKNSIRPELEDNILNEVIYI